MKFKNKLADILPRSVIRLVGWSAFAVFFITVCLPLLFFYYLFDAQQVKQMVINQFNNQNYSVVINGSVEPRSWHGLSLFISDLTVEDKSKHKVLHVNTANFQLSWLDLIVGHYRVRRAALNGLTYYQGNANTNYNDLFNYQKIASSEFKNLTHVSMNNFTVLNNAGVFILKDASLKIDNLEDNPSFSMQLNLIKYNAKFSLQGQVSKTDDDNVNIQNITLSLISPHYDIELQSSGHYAYRLQELWLENARGVVKLDKYQGVVTLDSALLSGYGLTINSLSSTLNGINSLNNQSIIINADRVNTNDFNNYQVNKLISKFELANSDHNLAVDLGMSNLNFNNNLDVDNNSCNLDFKYASLNHQTILAHGDLAGKCSVNGERSLMQFQMAGKINQSPVNLNLGYNFRESVPNIKLNANITSLDFSKILANGSDNTSIYYDNSRLPFNWLGVVNFDADLRIKQLKMSHIALSDVVTKINASESMFDVSQISAHAYDGTLSGTASLKKVGESYNVTLQNEIHQVNLQNLFGSLFNVSAIKGKADVLINTTANGVASYVDLHKKLSGKVSMTVNNGGFSGIDFSLFLSPENLAAFQSGSTVMTNFTSLNADFEFTDGVSKAGAIKFSSPTIAATGSGIINFADTTLNYNLVVASILPRNVQNVKSVSIPIVINGNLFSPKIYIKNMTLNKTEVVAKSHKNTHKKEK